MSGNTPYFEPESRLQLVDKINHLIRFSDFLLLLTGDAGVGKSRLLQQLVPAEADSSVACCRLQITPGLSTDDLLRQLLKQQVSHVQVQGDAQARLSALNDHIAVLRTQGQRLLLLVDDADRLSDDALSLLINLQLSNDNDDGTAPQLLFFGQPTLISKLQTLGWLDTLAGRVHQLQLEPFSDDEMVEYLRICHPEKASLSQKDIAALISASKGFPGRIDGGGAAPVVPQIPEPEQPTPPSEGKGRRAFPLPPLHMAGIALVLAAVTIGAAWTFAPKDETPDATVDTGSRISVPLNIESDTPPDVSGVSPLQSELDKRLAAQEAKLRHKQPGGEAVVQHDAEEPVELKSPDESQKRISLPLNLASSPAASPKTQNSMGDEAKVEPSVTDTASTVTSDLSDGAGDSTGSPAETASGIDANRSVVERELPAGEQSGPEAKAEIATEKQSRTPALPPFVSEKTRPEVVAAQSTREGKSESKAASVASVAESDSDSQKTSQKTAKPETAPVAVSETTSKTSEDAAGDKVATAPAAIVVEKKPAVKPAPAPSAKKSIVVETSPRIDTDEASLLQSPGSSYALQVLGARAVGSVDRFMRGHEGIDGLRAFATIFKGRPWYVVVYGEYSSRKQATDAVATLPDALRKQRPWARSMKGIHNDINKK